MEGRGAGREGRGREGGRQDLANSSVFPQPTVPNLSDFQKAPDRAAVTS